MTDLTLKVDIGADSKFPVNRKVVRERIREVLSRQQIEGLVEISITIVGDRKMATLNKKYRGKIGTTDVLSFPTHDPSQEIDEGGFFNAPENGLVLGDIIVSYPMAIKEAMQKNMMVDDVIAGLVEHGLMHLLGIHHPE